MQLRQLKVHYTAAMKTQHKPASSPPDQPVEMSIDDIAWPTLDDFGCGGGAGGDCAATTTAPASPSNPQAPSTEKNASYSDDDSVRNRLHESLSSSGQRTNPNQGSDSSGEAAQKNKSIEQRWWESANDLGRRLSQTGLVEFMAEACVMADLNPCLSPPKRSTVGDENQSPMSPEELAKVKQATALARRSTSMVLPRDHEEIEVLPNHKVQVRLPPLDGVVLDKKRKVPLDTLEVYASMQELERSISELTMRSSYAAGSESLNKIPDNRRMAYYAVGKHHRQNGRGGNRRCYFTGKLILGGAPFYAGSVQQGLRTLVVFCLPSALGLPGPDALKKARTNPASGLITAVRSAAGTITSANSRSEVSSRLPGRESRSQRWRGNNKRDTASYTYRGNNNSNCAHSVASRSMSKYSSLDDLSLSIDGDLDPNWGLDRDFLLSVLPPANANLLKQMSKLYPDQFETLPVQVREPSKWKLYVKFCFFSGLPIAEGEMHYKVRDDIADQVYGEEIVLSHEVMEAVNGESAEILTLPNTKAFRYLRKHYAQQCSKLDDRVFKRSHWEREAPEV